MKVLLLNAPVEDTYNEGKPTAPLGLFSIAAFLSERGIDARVRNLAFRRNAWDTIRLDLEKERPDIVGISFYTINRMQAYRLSTLIREVLPGTTVVMGGHHASYLHEQLLDNGYADVVVTGEGEQTFYDLVVSCLNKQPIDKVRGVAFKKEGRTVATPQREFIKDLDSLPFLLDRYSADLDGYYLPREKALAIAGGSFGPRPWEFPEFPLISSRGCPFHCAFCASTVLGGGRAHYWRAESPERVADKVQYLYEKENCRFLRVVDNSFNVQTDRVEEICQALIRRRLNIRWTCVMRADPRLNPASMLKRMKEAGCYKVSYGIESGSSMVLEKINKRISAAGMRDTLLLAKSLGLKVQTLLMVGNPGECDESIRDTVNLVKLSRPDELIVNLTIVYPGTDLYSMAKDHGLIDDDYWLCDHPLPHFPSAGYLKSIKWHAQLAFLNRRATSFMVFAQLMRTGLRRLTGVLISRRKVALVPRQVPLFDRLSGKVQTQIHG